MARILTIARVNHTIVYTAGFCKTSCGKMTGHDIWQLITFDHKLTFNMIHRQKMLADFNDPSNSSEKFAGSEKL
jgi:hypothetical protein